MPAHEKTIWWSHVTGANVRGISPEPWAHKSRPRSTSARSRNSIRSMRLRKMSASPPRRQSESTNLLNHGDVTINTEISEQELWAACAGKVDPYFSCHPPSAPIEVLIIGAPPTLPIAPTLARHEHDLKAVWPSLEQEDEEHVWLIPRLVPGHPPRPRISRPSRARVKEERAARRATRGTRRSIRRLLRDIITALPLLAPAEEQNDTAAGAEVAPSVDASISAQAVPPAPSPATRSVAVQAQTLKSSVDKGIMQGSHCQLQIKNTTVVGVGEKRARTPDAWMGGARALRDSHVRLVLRQLRHIERLNRALDHAVPALKHK